MRDIWNKEWDALTVAEMDARNEEAWAMAAQAIRDAFARDNTLDFDGCKAAAIAYCNSSIAASKAEIKAASKARARVADKARVPMYEAEISRYSTAREFVYDIDFDVAFPSARF